MAGPVSGGDVFGSGSGSGSPGRRLGKFLADLADGSGSGRPVFAFSKCGTTGLRRLGEFLFDWPAFWTGGASGSGAFVPSRPVFAYGDGCITRRDLGEFPTSGGIPTPWLTNPPCCPGGAAPLPPVLCGNLRYYTVAGGGGMPIVYHQVVETIEFHWVADGTYPDGGYWYGEFRHCEPTCTLQVRVSDRGCSAQWSRNNFVTTCPMNRLALQCRPFWARYQFSSTGCLDFPPAPCFEGSLDTDPQTGYVVEIGNPAEALGGECLEPSPADISEEGGGPSGSGSGSGRGPLPVTFPGYGSGQRTLAKWVGSLGRNVFAEACCPFSGTASGTGTVHTAACADAIRTHLRATFNETSPGSAGALNGVAADLFYLGNFGGTDVWRGTVTVGGHLIFVDVTIAADGTVAVFPFGFEAGCLETNEGPNATFGCGPFTAQGTSTARPGDACFPSLSFTLDVVEV